MPYASKVKEHFSKEAGWIEIIAPMEGPTDCLAAYGSTCLLWACCSCAEDFCNDADSDSMDEEVQLHLHGPSCFGEPLNCRTVSCMCHFTNCGSLSWVSR